MALSKLLFSSGNSITFIRIDPSGYIYLFWIERLSKYLVLTGFISEYSSLRLSHTSPWFSLSISSCMFSSETEFSLKNAFKDSSFSSEIVKLFFDYYLSVF